MKRFLVFAGDAYYPEGGMNDFQEDSGNYVSKYAESSALRSIGAYTFVCGISQTGTSAPSLTDNFNNYGVYDVIDVLVQFSHSQVAPNL